MTVTEASDTDPQLTLAAATRRLNDIVRRVRHDAAALAQATRLVDEAAGALAGDVSTGPFMQAGLDLAVGEGPPRSGSANANDVFPYSPIIGARNAISPDLDLWFDGGTTRGRMCIGAAHNGPPDMVHGGVIALIFDELLGVTAVNADLGGFTGTLSVRYEAPTPLLAELELWSEIDRVEGRKVFVVGEIRSGGAVTARAEGVFIRMAQD